MSEIGNTIKTGRPSLPESNRSVKIPDGKSNFRKYLAFAGPGYLISVGYMDPGNWATDLEGGSRFGYRLLWVVLLSNLMAILLQVLCARLGLATGKDLAQSCRDYYKRPAVIALWLLCEIAIIACDLAEVIGSAVALQLLFGLPLVYGVLLTGFDVLAIVGLTRYGFRKLEAVVLTLVGTVAVCFAIQMFLAKPDWAGVAHGLVTPTLLKGSELYIALGILGATVMPHNLYLHSAIVQTRAHDKSHEGVKQAINYNTFDTILALMLAFFVNGAILILAASAFHAHGIVATELGQAHKLLGPLLGGASSTVFAVALLASGQSSTITGTLAGQIVMEGFLHIRVSPWARRLITRSLAIVPAVMIVISQGAEGVEKLLVFSQVVLSMQLSFATFPLMIMTSDRKQMGAFVNTVWLKIVGYLVCVTIAALNMKLLYDGIGKTWLTVTFAVATSFAIWVKFGYKAPKLEKTLTADA